MPYGSWLRASPSTPFIGLSQFVSAMSKGSCSSSEVGGMTVSDSPFDKDNCFGQLHGLFEDAPL